MLRTATELYTVKIFFSTYKLKKLLNNYYIFSLNYLLKKSFTKFATSKGRKPWFKNAFLALSYIVKSPKRAVRG